MRAKAFEIRWHDTNPIFSADFHHLAPTQHKKPSHPYAKLSKEFAHEDQVERDRKDREKQWRLATCGGDKNVRLWLVTPRPPPTVAPLTLPVPAPADARSSSSSSAKPTPGSSTTSTASKPFKAEDNPDPKVEFLATLSQHTGVVNCVRFCPFGETLASAGDDGNILLWVPGEGTKKIGESEEDRAYSRESWRVKSMIRSMSGKEIYDLAWSPSGKQILAGSVDHTATIYDVATGAPLHRIAEHTNYVQGVAWDPRDEFIATQSSDRSMHVYSIAANSTHSGYSVHAVGKNSRMELQRRASSASNAAADGNAKPRGRTNDQGKESKEGSHQDVFLPPPRLPNRARSTSRASDSDRSEASSTSTVTTRPGGEAETAMEPPASIPVRPGHSRRSSTTSTSATSQSPALGPVSSRPLRSPSPAPLPAVMFDATATATATAPVPATVVGPSALETIKLYSDANSTPFFRRLSWSTDGSLLLTPAGMFEDPFSLPLARTAPTATTTTSKKGKKKEDATTTTTTTTVVGSGESKPTVYIYTRSNVSKPPVANLIGHRTTSIAIRFCPVLFDLRTHSTSNSSALLARTNGGEDGGDEPPRVELTDEGQDVPLPGSSSTSTSTTAAPKSLFDLPYRMLYAVATLDSVYLYDTQQEGPICMFGNLHYAPFTDLTWSPDGQTLILSSQDGYCSIVAFAPGELGTPYDGPRPGLAPTPASSSVATAAAPTSQVAPSSVEGPSAAGTGGSKTLDDLFKSAPVSNRSTLQPDPTSSTSTTVPEKRPASPPSSSSQPSAAPGASTGGGVGAGAIASGTMQDPHQPLVKKKKKVALTHVGPLGGGGGGGTSG
ncbi:hypothetical protein JCM11491_001096 [Sporobolomyces phaffii]